MAICVRCSRNCAATIWSNRPDRALPRLTVAASDGHDRGMTRVSSTSRKLALAAEALLALAAARFVLHRTKPADVQQRNREVAWAITSMSRRLPWRADCLVQALAGQRMLIRRLIASEIRIGTTKHDDGRFEAHA